MKAYKNIITNNKFQYTYIKRFLKKYIIKFEYLNCE